jgi:UDP-N-acetylglucosamine transferase subunit ALG13
VIFATCGSSHLAFERMMRSLSVLPAEELHVQHGPASPPPSRSAYRFLPFARMVELIDQADVVVTHAGVGSIMCALRAGHVPIVFPRLQRYGETVDDHQIELAEALASRGTVTVARTPRELRDATAAAPSRSTAQILDATAICSAVRSAIHGNAPCSQQPRGFSSWLGSSPRWIARNGR